MLKKIYLIILLLFVCSAEIHAQKGHVRINAGIGVPEFTHIGIGYQFADKNLAIFNYGFLPGFDNKLAVVTVEHFFFLKSSKKMEGLSTWYAGQKINLYRQTHRKTDIRVEHILLGVDIGRQFHFSETVGLKFDVGYSVFLAFQQKNIESNEVSFNKSIVPGIPTANLELFYRL